MLQQNTRNPPTLSDNENLMESQRVRELEEAKCRAAQMEKTMKWWSECTQNWREKWSKVRNERNKAREEAKQLRASLEQSLKESNSYKREKHELELQIQQLKKEMEKIHMCLIKHAGQFNKSGADSELAERDGGEISCSPEMSSDGLKNVNSEDGLVTKTRSFNESDGAENKELEIEEYILQGALPKLNNLKLNVDIDTEEKSLLQQLEKNNLKEDCDEDYTQQKIKMLQIRLDEAQKSCNLEREEKLQMHKNMEKLRQEMEEYRDKCEELRAAKQEAIRELLTMQEQHRVELRITNNSLQEEINSREIIERRLSELRTELERLQSENASEWAKRERLETEKINLERENKRLRMQEAQVDRFDRRGRPPMSQNELEMRALEQELIDKNKEITELRHSQSKMKKMLSEANTELSHAVRRADQYETEVKRLRLRVEELKKELAQAEDELDSATNHVRRLQRTNEELNGQTEGLQVQIQQLSTRHSSPQRHNLFNHHQKQLNAPTSSLKHLQHSEFKPNINDLKQLFDDTKRLNVDKMQQMQMQHQKHNYYDAKPSYLEHESFLENKTRVDFERVKQKFDSKSQNNNMKIPSVTNKYPNTSIPSSIAKQQQNSNLLRKHPNNVSGSPQMTKPQVKPENIPSNLINETIQFFDNDSSRMNHKKRQNDQMDDCGGNVGNFNLDGLEVSDDEGDVA